MYRAPGPSGRAGARAVRPEGRVTHLVVVDADLCPRHQAPAVVASAPDPASRLRVIAMSPANGFDWRSLAWLDALALDDFAWPVSAEPPVGSAARDRLEDQLLLSDLLERLRRRVVEDVDGWVAERGSLGPTVRDAVRDLARCCSITVLVGADRARLPAAVRRAAAWQAAGGRCAWRDVRIRRTTCAGPGGLVPMDTPE